MRKDREQATILRQSGSSYAAIKARLGIPRSTLSLWFRDQKWSNDIATESIKRARNAGAMRLMVLNAVRAGRLKKVYEDARQDARVDFDELRYHPLFIAGIMLYWCHGDKTSPHRVSLASMDPRSIQIFISFLKKICGVEKIRVQLLLGHDHGREDDIRAYWIEKSGLKHEYFMKSVKIKSKKRAGKPYFGVCNIIVNSAYLKNKILRWVELVSEDIAGIV